MQAFASCYSVFRSAVERTELELPNGQLSHVLRHTFASRFMQAGGSILVLQRALGHGALQMTMRYSHFGPEHLEQVRELNVVARAPGLVGLVNPAEEGYKTMAADREREAEAQKWCNAAKCVPIADGKSLSGGR